MAAAETTESIDTTFVTPYAPRRVAFQRLVALDGWLVKVYAICLPGRPVDEALLGFAIEAARRSLPPRDTPGVHGLAFLTVHDAADFSYALVDWWVSENEIHQDLLSSDVGDAAALRRHPSQAIGCVWELSVTDFERRAWIETILANPAGPDVDAYLAKRLVGDV